VLANQRSGHTARRMNFPASPLAEMKTTCLRAEGHVDKHPLLEAPIRVR